MKKITISGRQFAKLFESKGSKKILVTEEQFERLMEEVDKPIIDPDDTTVRYNASQTAVNAPVKTEDGEFHDGVMHSSEEFAGQQASQTPFSYKTNRL